MAINDQPLNVLNLTYGKYMQPEAADYILPTHDMFEI